MFPAIDKIVFGNPCKRDHDIIKSEHYLDRLIQSIKQFTPPKNSSASVHDELNSLVNFTLTDRVAQNNLFDERLVPYIKEVLLQNGGVSEEIDFVTTTVQKDVLPLITKLKYFFNRPRPAQLAFYYQIPLFPDFSYFTNTPSYPSGHTTLTAVTCEVLGNYYPTMYQNLRDLSRSVAASRLLLGVHYPSDNDMAFLVAKKITEYPAFRKRFSKL